MVLLVRLGEGDSGVEVQGLLKFAVLAKDLRQPCGVLELLLGWRKKLTVWQRSAMNLLL